MAKKWIAKLGKNHGYGNTRTEALVNLYMEINYSLEDNTVYIVKYEDKHMDASDVHSSYYKKTKITSRIINLSKQKL